MDKKLKPESQEEVLYYLIKDNEKYLREKLGLVLYKHDERDKPEYITSFEINGINIPILHPLDCTKNWADIPCFDENNNNVVIIEVKSSEVANHKTFGQVLYYLTLAKRIKYANGKEVKNPASGIIIAKKNIHSSLRTLLKEYDGVIPKVDLKYYQRTNEGDYIFFDAKGRLRKKS